MAADMIEVRELTKYFAVEEPLGRLLLGPFGTRKKICALDKVGFSITSGEILGVVGANGAGKTTLLRILADLLSPDSGKIELCGYTLGKDSRRLRGRIGYVPSDERSFFWRLTGKQNLEFFARLYGISKLERRRRIEDMLKVFSLNEKADELFRDYSSGTRKKFSLMRALNLQPHILLLDEITNSLDVSSAEVVKTLVKDYISNQEHCAAVWSTHRLEEVGEVCDKVLMIENGRVRFHGMAADFLDSRSERWDYLLRVKHMNGSHKAFDKWCSKIKELESSRNGDISEFLFKGISAETFGCIVTMAIEDCEGYVIFAGCLGKSKSTGSNPVNRCAKRI